MRKRQNNWLIWISVLIICQTMIIIYQVFFSQSINSRLRLEVQFQTKESAKRVVMLTYNSIEHIVEKVRSGELGKDEARELIADIVRKLVYTDDMGQNYVFMSGYDGTILVQPFDNAMEGTNQLELKDADGNYIIRGLITAAKKQPAGSYVEYSFYPPNRPVPEKKLSFVMGIPEIDAYIGTGMYASYSFAGLKQILNDQKQSYMQMNLIVFVSFLLFIMTLYRSNKLLSTEVSGRKQAEENMMSVFDTIYDGVMVHDISGKILQANKSCCEIFQVTEEEILSMTILDLSDNSEAAQPGLKENREKVITEGYLYFEWKGRRPHTGELFDEEIISKRCIWSGHDAYVLAVRDISDKKKAEAKLHEQYMELEATKNKLQQNHEEIENLAYYDYLTGLPNRVSFTEELRNSINKCSEEGNFVAINFIDMDNFKFINDTFGHSYGDKVLILIAERLDTFTAGNIRIFRIGGDEFIVIHKDYTDISECIRLTEKLLSVFKAPISIDDNSFYSTCSIGVAIYPMHGSSMEEIFKNADLAMYKAKNSGKNGYVLYEKSIGEELSERMQLERDLREAFENNEFELYYQPQVETKSRRISGFEALLRWNSPKYGQVPPGRFIPVAEEMGLINDIGKWVIEQSFKFAKSLQGRGICISCNVSPLQLIQSDFTDTVIELFQGCQLEPGNVALEITENILVESFEDTSDKLKVLRRNGILVYLDDFGTGYSSLTYLKSLPIDIVKIDKQFIDDIITPGEENSMVKSIISLAHDIGLKVVAEGVEEEIQREYLAACQCCYIQGYLISRPVPEKMAVTYLSSKPE